MADQAKPVARPEERIEALGMLAALLGACLIVVAAAMISTVLALLVAGIILGTVGYLTVRVANVKARERREVRP